MENLKSVIIWAIAFIFAGLFAAAILPGCAALQKINAKPICTSACEILGARAYEVRDGALPWGDLTQPVCEVLCDQIPDAEIWAQCITELDSADGQMTCDRYFGLPKP